MKTLHLYFTVKELAYIIDQHPRTIHRHMKLEKVNRTDPLSVIRFIYPRLMIAFAQGIPVQKLWKDVLQARKEAAEKRKDVSIRGQKGHILTTHRNSPPAKLPTLADTEDLPQTFPEY